MAAASFYKQSYFFDPAFDGLPTEVKKDIRVLTTIAAEKTRGIVCVGFCDGAAFIEPSGLETDGDYDEIHARTVIDGLVKEKAELMRQVSEWYRLFMTDDGKAMRDKFLKKLPL